MNRRLKVAAVLITIFGIAAFIFAYAWLVYTTTGMGGNYDYVNYNLFLIVLVLSLLTSSFFHELGHALFGLFSGVRAKISFKTLLPWSRAASSEIIPLKEDKLKSRLIATLSGGLAVNFLFIVIGFLAFVPGVPEWFSGFAVGNFGLFVKNVLPIEYSTGKTDVLVISELIKNSPEGQVALSVLKVQAQVLNGKPLEQIDKSLLFGLPQIREDDLAFIALTELQVKYLIAVGDGEGASERLDRLEQLKRDYLG